MPEPTETVVKAKLLSGAVIHVEAVQVEAVTEGTSAEREVVDLKQVFSFEDLRAALEGIAVAIVETIGKIKPNKAAVEFGVEVGIASGQLTAVLVKGTGKANLKIKLEW